MRKQNFTDNPYGRKYRARLKAYCSLEDTDEGAQYLMIVGHTIWSCVQYVFLCQHSNLTVVDSVSQSLRTFKIVFG